MLKYLCVSDNKKNKAILRQHPFQRLLNLTTSKTVWFV